MDRTEARRASILIMAVFWLQPICLGSWFALIPFAQEALGLSKGQLAAALLAMPLALVPGLQIAGRMVARFGLRRVFAVMFPVQSLTILLPIAAWSGPSLFVALFVAGITIAFLEVGMNVYAGRLEKRADVMIMNRAHGFWALGLTAGSGFTALMAGVSPWAAMLPLAAVATVGGVIISRLLPRLGDDDSGETRLPRRRFADLPPALIGIAVFMLCATLVEGAMADWAAVHLAERMGRVEGAGLSVTIFSAALAAMRFAGDWTKRRMGAVPMARMSIGLALAGVLILVLPVPLALTYAGYALVGAGVAAAYPLGVSAVAAIDDTYESANIAIMATVALGGLVMGPPVIGFIAEVSSLNWGLAALIPALLTAMWLTHWLKPR